MLWRRVRDVNARRRRRLAIALTVVALLALCGLGAWRRLLVVAEYRNFAGDGWQYFHLAETLVKEHRFAFGPLLPPASSRLPGYPLVVAWFGHNAEKFDATLVGIQVTRAQVFLDLLTAIFAWLLARETGLRATPWLAMALCLASPFLALCCSYLLSETLAILLTTATLWLLARAARMQLVNHLAIAGALLGVGLLVRADALTLAPCFAVPLLLARAPRREKLRAALFALLAFAVVYGPWPLRNLVDFHRPYPLGSSWVKKTGDPLPTGVHAWLRTWAVDPEAATVQVAWKMTRGDVIIAERLPREASDSPAERKQLVKLFTDYNAHGITRTVDAGFRELAAERTRREPYRTFIQLPLARAWVLWSSPVPEWELPCLSPTLRLPAERPALAQVNARTIVLALLGLSLLSLLADGRRLVLLAVTAIVARSLLVAWVVPGGTQRYLFELLPMVLVLAAAALAGVPELAFRRWFPATRAGDDGSPPRSTR